MLIKIKRKMRELLLVQTLRLAWRGCHR
jgi:hypothetical protein